MVALVSSMQDTTFTRYLAGLVTHVTQACAQVAELLFEFAGATLVITLAPQGQIDLPAGQNIKRK
jgi:hypothetical protein